MFDSIRRLVCRIRGDDDGETRVRVDDETMRRMREIPQRLDRLIAVEQGKNPVEQTIIGRRKRYVPPPKRRRG